MCNQTICPYNRQCTNCVHPITRYCDRKITIISSEHTIDELISYDEAIGSRVYEMSRNSNAIIPQAIENNYRMKG